MIYKRKLRYRLVFLFSSISMSSFEIIYLNLLNKIKFTIEDIDKIKFFYFVNSKS